MHYSFVLGVGYQATTITVPNETLYFEEEEYFFSFLNNMGE